MQIFKFCYNVYLLFLLSRKPDSEYTLNNFSIFFESIFIELYIFSFKLQMFKGKTVKFSLVFHFVLDLTELQRQPIFVRLLISIWFWFQIYHDWAHSKVRNRRRKSWKIIIISNTNRISICEISCNIREPKKVPGWEGGWIIKKSWMIQPF